jgi:hypothetical protein
VVQSDPNKEFDCNFCHKKHTPPDSEGFPLNGTLMRLLKVKAGSVYRNERVDQLKIQLDDLKSKCDEFKFSLDNGVDQVREHCTRLRNQVHLETDILIEEVHKFNESLIVEIDKYEQECIDSLSSNLEKKNENADELVIELNDFYYDKIKYLAEFKIDGKEVDEAITKANGHFKKFRIENRSLKKIQFSGKVVKFRKSQNKIDRTLLGTLVYKSISSYVDHISEIKLTNNVMASSSFIMHLCKHQNGNNFAFWIDTNYFVNLTSFDNDGSLVKQVTNALSLDDHKYSVFSQFKVTQSLNNFIFYAKLPGYGQAAICGHKINDTQPITGLIFILNQNFDYIKHTSNFSVDQNLLHMAANSSRVLWIDSSYNFFFLDMNLAQVKDKSLKKIKNQVGRPIVDVQMSDKYVFFLCQDKKLRIFSIESGDLVKEFETSANQIKLASVDRLVLFDSGERVVYLHEQTDEFKELEEINLAHSLDEGLKINRDLSNCLTFYNSKSIKCTYLD